MLFDFNRIGESGFLKWDGSGTGFESKIPTLAAKNAVRMGHPAQKPRRASLDWTAEGGCPT